MAQRGLLTEDERQLVFGVPRQEHLIIKHYTLNPDDLDLALRKRGARNQLGFAVQLCLLRHPGFGLRLNEAPSEGPAQAMDSQEPHLRNLLAFIGITDVTFIRAEKLTFGPEAREQAIDAARQQIGETISEACRRAA
jgi:FMN-dependent NADH-azoreductase